MRTIGGLRGGGSRIHVTHDPNKSLIIPFEQFANYVGCVDGPGGEDWSGFTPRILLRSAT